MINRCMRILVMFDLPVDTKEKRKQYTNFHKFLINDGYIMMQYSVYSRVTLNHDDMKKHIQRLIRNLPKYGSVRVLELTEKQYNSMKILVGEKTAKENYLVPKDIIEI